MTRMIYSLAVMLMAASANGTDLNNRDAYCALEIPGACAIRYNLASGVKRYYKVQQLDELNGQWRTLTAYDDSVANGSLVEPGYIYRIAGCNDRYLSDDCLFSRVFWAPVVLEEAEIPGRVRMTLDEGGEGWAMISKESKPVDQLRQLNVYRFSEVMSRAGGLLEARMTRPVPHSHDPTARHDENLIHHDVYQQFNAIQRRLASRP